MVEMILAHRIAHLLLPRHTNNHKARALHPSALTLIAIAIFLFQGGMGLFSRFDGDVLGYASNISALEVIRLTNEKRAQEGLPPLRHNPALSQAAAAKGAHMLAFDYWAHVAPDGTQPWKFFADIGYKYKYAGENLARDFSNPSAAVNAWMASPSHRENMLASKYQEIGIGVVEGDLGGVDTTLVVQFFGTNLADSLAPEPVAAAVATSAPTVRPLTTAVPRIVALATPIPTPIAITPQSSVKPVMLESGVQNSQVLISPFSTAKGLSFGIIGFTLALFIIDLILVTRRKTKRISGRTMAHIAFFGMILLIILIVQAGRIL